MYSNEFELDAKNQSQKKSYFFLSTNKFKVVLLYIFNIVKSFKIIFYLKLNIILEMYHKTCFLKNIETI